jgi:hypothetical protein
MNDVKLSLNYLLFWLFLIFLSAKEYVNIYQLSLPLENRQEFKK